MDIRIVTIGLPHSHKCSANMGFLDNHRACGKEAAFLLQNNRAAKRNEPSVGYVCEDHLGNVIEWYVSEDRK